MKISDFIRANVPEDAIVIEAGSWNGADTYFFSQHLKKGKVYSFEPFPNFYYESMKNLYGLPNVELYPYALAEKTQEYTLYVSEIDGKSWCSNSIFKPKDHLITNPHVKFDKEIKVQGKNLDEFINEKGIKGIGMIWFDIQGAEYSVLKASPKTLGMTKFLYTEVSLVESYESTPLYHVYKKFLEEQGFQLIYEDLPNNDMGDALFVNTRV